MVKMITAILRYKPSFMLGSLFYLNAIEGSFHVQSIEILSILKTLYTFI